YDVKLTSTGGCDSIATLILTVNDVLTSTARNRVGRNQLPYSWNGNNYTAAGTYDVTLTSTGGCDSIATLILTVNDVLTSTTEDTICVNQLPYTWNGNDYTAAGTYDVNLTSTGGCDSIATLILTVNDVLTSTTEETICEAQLPYTWNGQSITAAGIYTANLTSVSGCDSVATLNLTVSPALTRTENVSVCASSYTLPDGTVVTS